jgi:hypothetical protein
MKSDLLKRYFDELGLTDELLGGRSFYFVPAARYDLPPTDKIVAILLYPPDYNDSDHPLALFGDKELTERLRSEYLKERGFDIEDRFLKPKKIFEGRLWIEKITDAYRYALEEGEKRKYHPDLNHFYLEGKIIFVTMKNGYEKLIGVDANAVYDCCMESTLLKKYFDELGLTKELLVGKP